MTFFQKSKPEGLVALPNIHISCVISYFFFNQNKGYFGWEITFLAGPNLFYHGLLAKSKKCD